MIHSYNQNARRRIRDAVLFSERHRKSRSRTERRHPVMSHPQYVIVDNAIASRAVGTAKVAVGEFGGTWTPGTLELSVYNPGAEVPAGTEAIAIPTVTAETTANNVSWSLLPSQSQAQKVGVTSGQINPNAAGTIVIYRNGSAVVPQETIEAKLDWMHGGQAISSGKQVLISYFADENVWRIIGAECE